ncbi:hypothetical protein RB13115 [Rhodopirellula baltica SH 1]|uniref:Uncharacterized protein n=1 Tax=Rhodopirellula baltica (strain DSM 10527 / NCIMB 13988 / SH1) TaxID=243090 RepID=Q7UHL9_RHOBA|nr:hypothetical protein RB13115 [Rhodopirellula baltica SH 1]
MLSFILKTDPPAAVCGTLHLATKTQVSCRLCLDCNCNIVPPNSDFARSGCDSAMGAAIRPTKKPFLNRSSAIFMEDRPSLH